MAISRRVWADIDLSAIKENFKILKKGLKDGVSAMAVIKADAYGHGDVAVARELSGVADAFAVATAQEALNLRKNSVSEPIQILSFINYEEYADVIKEGIDVTLFDFEAAYALSQAAVENNTEAGYYLKIDTGMNRIGFRPCDESVLEMKKIQELPSIKCRGVFTHFYKSDALDQRDVLRQYEIFTSFIKKCEKEGISLGTVHCSNSAAGMRIPEMNMDMVRFGISIYGLDPSDEVRACDYNLKPALSLKSTVIMVKEIYPGETVGYGGTFTADKKRKIATVSAGYADGIPRGMSNRGFALAGGCKVPIVGRVCMDQLMLDVTEVADIKRGDVVTFIGDDKGNIITVEDASEASGRFNYEFVCDLAKRVPRNYYRNGTFLGQHSYFYDSWQLVRS